MIFEEVVLHNFGAYQGEKRIALDVSSERPVVLVGAMNGSGKTTLLDAMQLALYGKAARCTGRERISYNDYLISMYNRNASPHQGAGVEFSFRTRSDGHDSRIRVKRSWTDRGKDHLEVFRNGSDTADSVASERWQEFVEDFMPSQIADLFFFDGEKIEALADPTRSAALLRVGVHSLLGIDLVESLIKSLQVVERKRKAEGASDSELARLDVLEKERQEALAKIRAGEEKLGSLRTEKDVLNNRLNAALDEFKRSGGELFNRHEAIERERAVLLSKQTQLKEQLIELSSGVLPLAITTNLLEETINLATHQLEENDRHVLLRELPSRDASLLKYLDSVISDKEAVSLVSSFLASDRESRTVAEGTGIMFPDGLVVQYRSDVLLGVRSQAKATLVELGDVKERLAAMESNLAAIPNEDQIAALRSNVVSLKEDLLRNEMQTEVLQSEILELKKKESATSARLEKLASEFHKVAVARETTARVIMQSHRSRQTLGRFRDRLLQNNLDRLQETIGECFRKLLRKQGLVNKVLIDHETFALSVVEPTGQIVPAYRLSAGERQLLAVATIWALSKASGRQLPAVIDTPLSRLDSNHRRTVVENYFPNASHQVILLSTDEEVIGRYYDILKPNIGRQYLIEHDEVDKTSRFLEGKYFSGQQAFEEAVA